MAQFSLTSLKPDTGRAVPADLTQPGTFKVAPVEPAQPGGKPLSSIGIGKPLTVELVYASVGGMQDWSKDLLICSMVKQIPVFDAAPRAVNVLTTVGSKKRFARRIDSISAGEPWTPVIYHSPSLSTRAIAVTVEATFDRFDPSILQTVGKLLKSAGGLPIFAPASVVLGVTGELLDIGSRVLEKLIDGKPDFLDTFTISLDRPGMRDTPASVQVLYQNSLSLDRLLQKNEVVFDEQRGLVYRSDPFRPLETTDPYFVLQVDGTPRPDYAQFSPNMASAALLERFLHHGNGNISLDAEVLRILKTTNDTIYRTRARELLDQAKALDPAAAGYADRLIELKTYFDATIGNVQDADLRPKWPF